MKKVSRKLIAVILSALMVTTTIPIASLAETTSENISDIQTISSGHGDAAPSPILAEADELREENTKHFRLEDGTYLAARYNQPVHYEENGEWKDIDNTLSLQAASDEEDVEGYENADNPVKIKLAKHADSKKLVKIKQGPYQISWEYAAADNHNAARTLDVAPLAVNDGEQTIDPQAVLNNLTSGVSYDDIEPGIDLQYILHSTSLKENIIVKQKRDSYTFALNLNVKKLTPTLQEDGSIDFANDNEEVVFSIPAPFMTDADGIYSENVYYSLEPSQKNKEYILTITADSEWMNAQRRAFPVTIDPIVSTSQTRTACSTVNVFSGTPDTSYEDDALPIIGQDDGTYRVYMEFSLPELPDTSMVTNTILSLVVYTGLYDSSFSTRYLEVYDAQLNYENVDGTETTIDNVVWENQAELGYVIDNAPANLSNQQVNFDITRLAKRWYEDGNSGLMIKSSDETSPGYHRISSEDYVYESGIPILTIAYTDAKGLENHWSYHTQSIGRVTASVNDFNGNLVVSHTDVTESNLRMPFSIVHVYNSAKVRSSYSKYGSTTAFGLQTGIGFQLNLQQRIDRITDPDLTRHNYAYVWLDGDGTQHYFKSSGQFGTWEDEDGLNLTLTMDTVAGTEYLYLADEEDNLLVFGAEDGLLYFITDNLPSNNNYIARRTNYIRLAYNGDVLQYVYNPEGEIWATFVYNSSNYLTQIKDRSNRVTSFAYNSWNQLTTITYPDGTSTKFDYFTNNAMYEITDPDDACLEYTYSLVTYGRVIEVAQKSVKNSSYSRTQGQSIEFSYLPTSCTGITYHTRSDNTMSELYEFDRYGRVFNIENLDTGGASNCVYVNSEDNDKLKNRIASMSSSQTYVNNLLNNSSCEWLSSDSDPYDWSATVSGGASCTLSGASHAHLGNNSFKITGGGSAAVSQRYDSTAGKTYTFSAYVKGGVPEYTYLSVEYYDASGNRLTSESTSKTGLDSSEWERMQLTFTVPDGVAYIKLVAGYSSLAGTVYFDCFQLEEGESADNYALLSNTDFEEIGANNIPTDWSAANTSSSDGRSARHPSVDLYYGFSMSGDMSKVKTLSQEVVINRPASEVAFALRSKGMGYSLPWYNNTFGMRLRIYYSDGTWEVSELIRLNPDTEALQTVTKTVSPSPANSSKTISKVHYILEYGNNANYCIFYQPQLYLDLTGTSYTYNDDGDLISAKDNAGRSTNYEYDEVNPDLLKSVTDTENNQTEYEYSETNPHQVVAIRQSATDTSIALSYDSVGNVTQTTYYEGSGEYYYATNEEKVVTSATTTNGGYKPYTSTDALGNMTIYTYGPSYRNVEEVTDPKGNETQYFYNSSNDRLTSVVGRMDEDIGFSEVAVDYTYTDGGKLERMAHNGFYYDFGYDGFGNQSGVGISKNNTFLNLVSNSYYDGNGPLKQVRYANGDTTSYLYDHLDRLDIVSYDDINTWQYIYDSRGNLTRIQSLTGGTNVFYQYDLIDRLVQVVKGSKFVIKYDYDIMDRLTQVIHSYDNSSKTTSYTYDAASRPTAVTLDNGEVLETNYDGLGRLLFTHHSVVIGQDDDGNDILDDFKLKYTYYNNPSGTQTGQVRKIQGFDAAENKLNQDYEYDANGNITHIYDAAVLKHRYYHYDGLNQLVREDNHEFNTSTVYTYDNGGNIVSKSVYPYSTGELGTATSTIAYGYTDVVWGDKLTSYNGQTINYDNIGNPLSYRDGMSFTWEHGRQMKTFTNSEGSTWEYTYDDSGYRTKKKLLNTTYEYMLDGSQVVCMKTPTNTVWFYYDATGQRVAMDIGGTVYYYMYNLMGDVLGLYDGAGNVVARYAYDAWGKILSIKDGSGNLLNPISNPLAPGIVNPFRYRGYMYDTESGLYYLNSRYYDPQTGRFINMDSLIVGDQYVLGANVYAYCANNPIYYSDPSGCSFTLTASLIVLICKGLAVTISAIAAVPLTVELGNQLADAVAGINITTMPIPSESAAIPIDPPIANDKEETIAIPIPDEATKVDTTPKSQPESAKYFHAQLLGSGKGIRVNSSIPFDENMALTFVTAGLNVWTPNREDAQRLAFKAGKKMALISIDGRICNPVGTRDLGCIYGTAAFHYHVYNRQYNDVHIFYDYQAVQFF